MAKHDTYVKTGHNLLTKLGNRLSVIPILGSYAAIALGGVGTLVDSAKWLMKGKLLSAATALIAGSVSTIVNAALNGFGSGINLPGAGILGNLGSGVITGMSAGTHARKLTEKAIGGLTGLVGQKPTVLRSYHAGIGSIGAMGVGGAPQRQQPGYWANRVAQEQGRDPQQRWQQYVEESRRDAAMAGSRA